MKIAHVLTSLNLGGQERVAFDLAVEQSRRGHDVFTISLDEGRGPLALEYNNNNLPVIGVKRRNDGFDWDLPKRMARLIKQHQFAVVHTHNPTPLIYAGGPAKWCRSRLVHTKHGINPAGKRLLTLRRFSSRFVDAYVCVSEQTEEVARKNKEASPNKITTIVNGTDLERFGFSSSDRATVRKEFSISDSAFVVGTVGRLYPEKNHRLLIESVQDSLSKDFQLMIVGEGDERAHLEKWIATLPNRDFIHLLGIRQDIPKVLSAFDVFALSSKNEGLPIVLLEAMATGLPIVSTSVGGIPDLVKDGELGLLVPSGDVSRFGQALLRFGNSSKECKVFGEAGKRYVLTHYSSARMTDEYMRVYVGDRK